LDEWCLTVGPPAISAADSGTGEIRSIVIVSWNVWVGGGSIEQVVAEARRLKGIGPDVGIVVLLQEAFRGGSAVPADYPRNIKVPSAIQPRRPAPDVMKSAANLRMSAIYIPSMRNGASTLEDRGNAVLSTEPLSDFQAIELPFGKQRRVAVICTVHPRGSADRAFRLVALHLDTSCDRKVQARELAKVLEPLGKESTFILAGGDLNSLWGRRDGAFKALNHVLPEKFCGSSPSNVWPLRLDIVFGWWRGRIDFMFSNLGTQKDVKMDTCETLPSRYGSDHHPLLAWLRL
jgi:endonuclease/exonuclease/phosphatase family metal-dependent hydrolase